MVLLLQGSIVALITPFLENGALDLKSFRHLVAWQIEQGSDGLVIAGSTGESCSLSFSEWRDLVSIAVEEARGRVPIIATTSSNHTSLAVQKTVEAKKLGADAGIATFPYYNRPMFEGCLAHFKEISKQGLPTIIYYHPGRTGVRCLSEQLAALCDLPHMIAMKDCSGEVNFSMSYMDLKGQNCPLFCGNDSETLPLIAAGAAGSISAFGNLLPKEWGLFVRKALAGELEKARSLFAELMPLCKAMELEVNPQCIKYAMSLAGHCQPVLRLPLILPQEKTRRVIEERMATFSLRDDLLLSGHLQ